jgi:hypothetical protein
MRGDDAAAASSNPGVRTGDTAGLPAGGPLSPAASAGPGASAAVTSSYEAREAAAEQRAVLLLEPAA